MVFNIVLVGVITHYWTPSFVYAIDSGAAKWVTAYNKHNITPTSSDSDSYEESNITSSDYNDDISPPEIPSDFSQKYFWNRRSTTPKETNSDEATEVHDDEGSIRRKSKNGKRRKREVDTTGNNLDEVNKETTKISTAAITTTRRAAKRRTRKPSNTTAKRRTRKPKIKKTQTSIGDSTVPTKRYATRISFFGEPVVVGNIEEETTTTVKHKIPNTTPHTEGPVKMITKISFWGGIVEVPAEHETKKPDLLVLEKSSEVTRTTTESKPSVDATKLAFGLGFVPFPNQKQEKTEADNIDHSTATAAKSEKESMTTVRMAP